MRQRVDGGGVDVAGVDISRQSPRRGSVHIRNLIGLAFLEKRTYIASTRAALIAEDIVNLILRILRRLALLLLLILQLFRCFGTGRTGCGLRALGAGNHRLVKTADGLRIHHNVARRSAALKIRRSRIVEDANAESAADANARAHSRSVHLHGAHNLSIGRNIQISAHVERRVRRAKVRLRIQAAHTQRQHGHHRSTARRAGRSLNVLRAFIGSVHPHGGKGRIAKRHAVFDPRGHVNANQANGNTGANARGVGGNLIRRLEGDRHRAKREAATRALAGCIAHGDVTAGASGIHAHRAAVDRIRSVFANQGIIDRRGQVRGNRSGKAKIRLGGNVSRLDDGAGGRIAHVCIYKQTLGGNCSAGNFCNIVVVEIGDTHRRADGSVRISRQRTARNRVKRRRSVKRAVGTHFGIGFAARKHVQNPRSIHRAGGVDTGSVVIVDIGQRQRTHELRGLCIGIYDLERLVKYLVDAFRAGNQRFEQAKGAHVLTAKQLCNEIDDLFGRYLCFFGIHRGNGNGYRAGTHAGGGIQAHIASQRTDAGRVQYLDRNIVINEGCGNKNARLGFGIQGAGLSSSGVSAGDHIAIGNQIDITLRLNARVAADSDVRIQRRHGQRQGEFGQAAGGIRGNPCIGISVQLSACTGLNQGVSANSNRGFAHRHANGNRNHDAGDAIGRVDHCVQLAAHAHGTARKNLAEDVNRRIAHLQHERLKFKINRNDAIRKFRNGQVAFAQRKAGQDVHRLGGNDLRIRANLNAPVAFGLIQTKFQTHILFGKVVIDDFERAFNDDIIRANRLQQYVFTGDISVYIDILAGHQHVHAFGQQVVNRDFTLVAGVINDVGK